MSNPKNQTQTTLYDFYGDTLIAIRDPRTNEVFIPINSALKQLGFTSKSQIRKKRETMISDPVLSKYIRRFTVPTKQLSPELLCNEQTTFCISQDKLPIAIERITITPSMKQKQPELAVKLELYQTKCAETLASAFITRQQPVQTAQLPSSEMSEQTSGFPKLSERSLKTLTSMLTKMDSSFESTPKLVTTLDSIDKHLAAIEQELIIKPKTKKRSYWSTKMNPKFQSIMRKFNLTSYKDLYRELFNEFENKHPEIDIDQLCEDYCIQNRLENCYPIEALEYNIPARTEFEKMVNKILEINNLTVSESRQYHKTIFH